MTMWRHECPVIIGLCDISIVKSQDATNRKNFGRLH